MTNSVDPDQAPHSVAFDLGLRFFPRPVCPNTKGEFGLTDLDPVKLV